MRLLSAGACGSRFSPDGVISWQLKSFSAKALLTLNGRSVATNLCASSTCIFMFDGEDRHDKFLMCKSCRFVDKIRFGPLPFFTDIALERCSKRFFHYTDLWKTLSEFITLTRPHLTQPACAVLIKKKKSPMTTEKY